LNPVDNEELGKLHSLIQIMQKRLRDRMEWRSGSRTRNVEIRE
jgi:hypothetical protein